MSQPRAKAGATPGKLALIAVLVVVLVGVIASNWPGAAAPPVDATAAKGRPASPVAAKSTETTTATPAAPFGEFAEDQHWDELPLSEVTRIDPFATAKWAVPPELADGGAMLNQGQINELLAAGNAIIFVAGDKRVARIGEQEFEVGDVIGRYTISDISPRGVVLSENVAVSE